MDGYLKYIDRQTNQPVKVMKYTDIRDFNKLKKLIGDVYPTITPAHTRIYQNNWVVRYDSNVVRFINCSTGDECFKKRYEPSA